MSVAGIDCGTNSTRLFIVRAIPDGSLRDLVREMKVVWLGQRVDRTGGLAQEALERAFTAAEEYGEACRVHGVTSVRFAATLTACDARNRLVFVEGVRSRPGVFLQILSGGEEVRVGFAGATSGILPGTESSLLAVDLGGGPTEIALRTMTGELFGVYSMDVGYVRMHERHLGVDMPDSWVAEAARRDVNLALDAAEEHVDLGAIKGFIGLAGSVTTTTAKALRLRSYDPKHIHGIALSVDETPMTYEWFLSSTGTECEALGFIHPDRVDAIPTGVLVWGEAVARAATRIREAGDELAGTTTSEHDTLDGLAMWTAHDPQPLSWRGSKPPPSRG